ncbi:MarR family transcriptional regulator [Pseudooceanicola sediminis]|uniref:MarR family transcriptional regulator n=1 Tax=Pseudooceanicola sediminis TaxID=2211117 RepID=A0A399IZS8_9RHOB|nr:MarR family transcriptional regulator [Pseudooceanicola sediminis]KAA2313604.1 MarR family transcriptional regulator [Puniceibacterium sp. HSS470]RII38551.1 MarR family transcriptional regulator [Pseudooceanicola sediminis]|tara:strand:+ start:7725 stop:8261 length:537 start_codon:yes stop_codon:yes gene_type:complete
MPLGASKEPDQIATPTRGDQRLRGFVGYSLKRAYHLIQSDAMRVLEPLGLRISTYSALAVICDNADLRQSQLAEILSIERSNTVVIIDALEKAGLIARHRVPTDRRSYALRATPEGRRMNEEATRVLAAHEDRILTPLSDDERRTMIALLRRIDGSAPSRRTGSEDDPEGGNRNERSD